MKWQKMVLAVAVLAPGAGRKPKAVAEKIATGNPGGRKLTVMDFGDSAEKSYWCRNAACQ